jgi:hypothetical protein
MKVLLFASAALRFSKRINALGDPGSTPGYAADLAEPQ